MEIYTGFAEVYDLFMDDIPYEAWCTYVTGLLKRYGIEDGLVLELGCGTGNMTGLLARQGYEMIGVDLSEEMLLAAREKACENNLNILFLHQDMREFELYGTVKAVVSVCDSMNYILSAEELLQVFRLVNNYLDPGGYFIFDMDTVYKYQNELADHTFAENREEGSYIWDNYYEEETGRNYYELAVFVRQESGLYEKHEELHIKQGYGSGQVKALLEKAGMEFIAVYDAFTLDGPREDSSRVYYVAREKGKSEK